MKTKCGKCGEIVESDLIPDGCRDPACPQIDEAINFVELLRKRRIAERLRGNDLIAQIIDIVRPS